MIERLAGLIPLSFFTLLTYFWYRMTKDDKKTEELEQELYDNVNAPVYLATIVMKDHDADDTSFKVEFDTPYGRIKALTASYVGLARKYYVDDSIPIKYYVNKSGVNKAIIANDEDEDKRRKSRVSDKTIRVCRCIFYAHVAMIFYTIMSTLIMTLAV